MDQNTTARPAYTRQETDLKSEDKAAPCNDPQNDAPVHVLPQQTFDIDGADVDSSSAPSEASTSSLRNALLSGGDAIDLTSTESEKWTTSRLEVWTWYGYYIGNSGLGPYNFAPIALQNILSLAATAATGPDCGTDGQPECRLHFGGTDRNVNSIVLLLNGVSFAAQAFLLLTIGSAADFGRGRPWILIVSTVICIASGFGWLGVTKPSQWEAASALYCLGLVTYQVCLTFWTSAFAGLARNLPVVRESARKLATTPPQTTAEEHHRLDVMQRNRMSNVSFFVCSAGELVILAVIQGMLAGVHANSDTETNTRALTYVIAFASAAWTLVALPWFLVEKHRPGIPLPKGMNIFTAGLLNAWEAARNVWTLEQSLVSCADA